MSLPKDVLHGSHEIYLAYMRGTGLTVAPDYRDAPRRQKNPQFRGNVFLRRQRVAVMLREVDSFSRPRRGQWTKTSSARDTFNRHAYAAWWARKIDNGQVDHLGTSKAARKARQMATTARRNLNLTTPGYQALEARLVRNHRRSRGRGLRHDVYCQPSAFMLTEEQMDTCLRTMRQRGHLDPMAEVNVIPITRRSSAERPANPARTLPNRGADDYRPRERQTAKTLGIVPIGQWSAFDIQTGRYSAHVDELTRRAA